MSMLILALIFQTGGQPAEENTAHFGVLLRAVASADLRQGLSTLGTDTLTAFPKASYEDHMFSLQASAAVAHAPDSQDVTFRPVSAGAFCRWPGSPWVSAGVFRGLRDPFIFGLSSPLSEWNAAGMDEINGVSAEAGGVLGFDGWWNQYGDTLSWYGMRSPWLGFGNVSWESMEGDSSEFHVIRGFADLRAVQPWFSFVSENDSWSGEGEIRGFSPFSSSLLTMEIVPSARWSEDSTSLELSGYFRGRSTSFSGFISAEANVDKPEAADIRGGFDMLSRAGVHWAATASLEELEYFSGTVSGFYRASPAGCGCGLSIEDDSLAVTATALYSPVRGVSSALSVSTDLSTGSPDPTCNFGVFAAGNPGSAGFTVKWEEGTTELGLGVSAWID